MPLPSRRFDIGTFELNSRPAVSNRILVPYEKVSDVLDAKTLLRDNPPSVATRQHLRENCRSFLKNLLDGVFAAGPRDSPHQCYRVGRRHILPPHRKFFCSLSWAMDPLA